MKRFYTNVTVEPAEGGWRAALDGRGIRTAGGKPQIVPTRALAEALAGEWAAQGDKIDAAAFPLRDLADLALDVVAGDRAEAERAILAYAETDTLCYRADPDEPLYHRQQEMWEPLLKGIESRHTVRFARISGIIHRQQPRAAHWREWHRHQQFGVVGNACTSASIGPGPIEHVLAVGMTFQVSRHCRPELAIRPAEQVMGRMPAAAATHTAAVLKGGQKGMTQERLVVRQQGVPVLRVEFV